MMWSHEKYLRMYGHMPTWRDTGGTPHGGIVQPGEFVLNDAQVQTKPVV
jgi:hypothetical protein